MGWFGISRELEFGVCNHSKPCAISCIAREEHSYGEGKEAGRAIVTKKKKKERREWERVPGFHWLESLPGKKSFLLNLVIISECESSPSGLLTLFNWSFCLLISYKTQILQFLFAHTGDQEVELIVPTYKYAWFCWQPTPSLVVVHKSPHQYSKICRWFII